MDPYLDETSQTIPAYRLTIRRNGQIRATPWAPWMANHGPMYVLLEQRGRRGVTLADLTVLRDDAGIASEVIVEFLSEGAPDHRPRLLEWAAFVGYRRVWFPEEVVDVEPVPGGQAETRCACCGARIVDETPALWQYVRGRGAFPTACIICGAELPQWWPVSRRDASWRGRPHAVLTVHAADCENVQS
jgi:hypothetical protein